VGARKIGAACNAFAEKAMERSAEARSAEALRKGEARRAEPTWRSLHAEARRAEGRGPKVEARRAEAKYWARKIGAACNALANKSVESAVPRRVAPRSYKKASPEGRSRRATVFMLKPAGPKVAARRAEAKFWVWLI